MKLSLAPSWHHVLAVFLLVVPCSSSTTQICDGYQECKDQKLDARNVGCYGRLSCENATVSSPYLYSYGYLSNYGGDLRSPWIFGYGNEAMKRSRVTGANYLYGYGRRVLEEAQVTARYLYSYGFEALWGAKVVSRYVYLYGFRSGYLSTIEPRQDGQFNLLFVYVDGKQAAGEATVTCPDGDYCRLFCKGDGCLHTKFICVGDADCEVSCSEEALADPRLCPVIEYPRQPSTAVSPSESRAPSAQPSTSMSPSIQPSIFPSEAPTTTSGRPCDPFLNDCPIGYQCTTWLAQNVCAEVVFAIEEGSKNALCDDDGDCNKKMICDLEPDEAGLRRCDKGKKKGKLRH